MKHIDQTTDPYLVRALAQAIQALAGKPTEAQAQQALVPALRQFGQTSDPDVLRALAQAIQALPAKLTEAQAQQALAPVLQQISQTTRSDALQILSAGGETDRGASAASARPSLAADQPIKRLIKHLAAKQTL